MSAVWHGERAVASSERVMRRGGKGNVRAQSNQAYMHRHSTGASSSMRPGGTVTPRRPRPHEGLQVSTCMLLLCPSAISPAADAEGGCDHPARGTSARASIQERPHPVWTRLGGEPVGRGRPHYRAQRRAVRPLSSTATRCCSSSCSAQPEAAEDSRSSPAAVSHDDALVIP